MNRCPSIHIVACDDNSAYAISHKLKNMLKVSDFKGNIFNQSIFKRWVNIFKLLSKVPIEIPIFSTNRLTKSPKQFDFVFDYDNPIIIFCGNVDEFCNDNVESHIHISNNTRK